MAKAKKTSADKNMIPFKQLGFVETSETGTQKVGDCLFCGGKSKMHINPEKKMFDCKTCLIAGGYKTLLKEIVKASKEAMNGDNALKLSKAKGLPPGVLRLNGMGFNPNNGSYLLPIYDAQGKEIWDIRIFKQNKFMSLSGSSVGLFGWDKLSNAKTVYLAEGEFDKMAMQEIIGANASTKDTAVAASVPGAGTFKMEWASLFKGKDVVVCYDNDDAGKRGAQKVYNALRHMAGSLKFVHWPDSKKDGFDLRDHYIDNTKKRSKGLKTLSQWLYDTPPLLAGEELQTLDQTTMGEDEAPVVLDGDFVHPTLVHEKFRKWLWIPDTTAIDVMFATAIANRLEGDPIWMFLVAPPGGTKTELLNTISDAALITTTSSLTPKSLVSGANIGGGQDPSLIPKLNNKVLIVKDFTTILDMHQMLRDEIFGILRDAYDGKTEKDFGNGVHRSYKSKFGIISGVTPAIEIYTEGATSLGERWLKYNVPIPYSARERAKYLEMAEKNAGKENQMRTELAEAGASVLNYDFKKVPIVPEKIKMQVRSLALYVSKMRGTVVRDRFSKEITHQAYSELGTRLVKQFTKLMYGMGMFYGLDEINDYIFDVVRHMGTSSIPSRLDAIIRYMWLTDQNAEWELKEICAALKVPKAATGRMLENLMMLDMVERVDESQIKANWKLTEDAIYLLESSNVYEGCEAIVRRS